MSASIFSVFIDDLQIHGGSNGISLNLWAQKAQPRIARIARGRSHGSIDQSKYYDGRTYSLEGFLEVSDPSLLQPLRDQLAAKLALGSSHLLVFTRGGLPGAEQSVVQVGTEFTCDLQPQHDVWAPWSVDLFAADPLMYAEAETSGSYDPTAAGTGGGVSFPLAFALTFPGTTGAELLVDNNGTYETPAVFTITGPVTNPIIDNDTTGDSIYTQSCTLSAGQTLTIDTGAKTCLLGAASRPDLISASLTKWMKLPPGPSVLRMRGSGMSAGSTGLAVTFRDARI